ncbi:DUF1800 domain-containing protein [Nocardioides donggukensis]|uniref:DUF1800 domain-containing protein n=1 Tax=Nocardioides donggukensis TaxID=2774019 RepID=A0A927K578_9ACTN|nr:DUF1800 domain-containing protein [Nocardioides donggukensis]MBD8870018.1 DUF1800 domain-containing protein [Nocardioides donggukensis]
MATATPTRRTVLVGAAATPLLAAAPAAAAPDSDYSPARYRRTKILGRRARHLASRFSYGVTPKLARQVRKKGGGRDWFSWQLAPQRIRDRSADELRGWWPGLELGPAEIWRRHTSDVEPGWVAMANYQRYLIARRITTRRQLLEVMTEFWEEHLHVPVNGDAAFVWRRSYGDLIRSHALGRFDEMLTDAITHPAMLIFLDNAVSTKKAPNENLGRELLELHTVGRGNYDEADVKDSARILTGWRVDLWKTWAPSYRPEDHATGPVAVMGFSDANADPDGRALTRRYLRWLARHPATAHRLATKLAERFVSDTPSAGLVEHLASVYLDHDTAIAPVLRALVESTEFAGSAGAKVRDPAADVVATWRVLGAKARRPETDQDAANARLWQCSALGLRPHSWPRPDGAPADNTAWSSPARVLASFEMHYTMSGGWWPKKNARFRSAQAWVPEFPIRFDRLVDHLSRRLLHRPSDARLLEACCLAVDVRPGERITKDHAVVRWRMVRLLAAVLDTPAHFTR